MVERRDVVVHLLDVIALLCDALVVTSLEAQQVGDLGLRTFDARTEDRLEPDEGSDQQVRVRKETTDASQAMQCSRRVFELADKGLGVVRLLGNGSGW